MFIHLFSPPVILVLLFLSPYLFAAGSDIMVAEDETYTIKSDLTISQGYSLTLNPGSSLVFGYQKSLTLSGSLFATDAELSVETTSSAGLSSSLTCQKSSSASFSGCSISSINIKVDSGASWVMEDSSVVAPVANYGSMFLYSSSLSKKLSNKSSGKLYIEDSSLHYLYLDGGSLEMHGGDVYGQNSSHEGYSIYLFRASSTTSASVLLDGVQATFGLKSAGTSVDVSLTVQDSDFGGDLCNTWASVWKGASSCASVSSSGAMNLEKGAILSVGDSVTLSAKSDEALLDQAALSTSSLGLAQKNTPASMEHLIAVISSTEFSVSSISLSDSSLVMTANQSALHISETELDASSSVCGGNSDPLQVCLDDVILHAAGATILSADFSLYADTDPLSPVYLFDLSSVFSNAVLSGDLTFDLTDVAFSSIPTDTSVTLLFDLGSTTETSSDFNYSATGLSLSASPNISVLSGNTSIVPEPSSTCLCLFSLALLTLRKRRS